MKQVLLLPAFQEFMRASAKGKRRTASGKRLTEGTIQQYQMVHQYLHGFETTLQQPIRIQLLYKQTQRQFQQESNYWKKIKLALEQYLRKQHKCLDVYIAAVFKVIKTFFNYLRKEKGLPVGEFHRQFQLPSYQYQPVLIDTFQLQRLINDTNFRNALQKHLAESLDLFIIGCLVGLRYIDLINLKKTSLSVRNDQYYLQVLTQKTGTQVNIPLPLYAVEIIDRLKQKKTQYLFKRISNTNFNLHLKQIMELAGYTYSVPKMRYSQGRLTEIKTKAGNSFRFCDHISSHTMRRTAITNLLVLGVPEMVVRKISGHAAGSKEFYRYISLAQDYTNRHLTDAYDKLLKTA
ncbi:MAG: tyrosine-type recombinase/integrase [Chitinophagaceae bacterium]|nr:tyrosine-type recombinase/integrase [Chitinophagaceae bacterium]